MTISSLHFNELLEKVRAGDEATEYFNKAETWMNAFAPSHPVLLQLRRWADKKIRPAER